MAEIGAFAFGVVIGWFTYFTNRYRTGAVQFSDITTLVGIIGGGAVTALFGEARTVLFGAYGLGLAIGFFAYFAVLVFMVAHSDGVFTWTWFLDGRRKAPKDDETVDGTRGSGTAMDVQFPMPAAAKSEASLTANVVTLRNDSVEHTFEALRALSGRIGDAEDETERARLVQLQMQLTARQNDLVGLRLQDLVESERLRTQLVRLRVLAGELGAAAGELKASPDAVAAASGALDRLERIAAALRTTLA